MPWRLVILVTIPTMVAVTLGGVRVATSWHDAEVYRRAEQLALLGNRITLLVHNLASERDATSAFIGTGRLATGQDNLRAQYRLADEAADHVREALSKAEFGAAKVHVRAALGRLDDLRSLRDASTGTRTQADTVIEKYSDIISDLLSATGTIAQGTGDSGLSSDVRALNAFSRAKEQASRQRAILYIALIRGTFEADEFDTFLTARGREASELKGYITSASATLRQAFEDTVTGPEVDLAKDLRQRAIALGAAGRRLALDPTTGNNSEQWLGSMGGLIDRMLLVEGALTDSAVAHARHGQATARRGLLTDGAFIVAVLLLALLATVVIAQSLVRPLRRLRAGALEVAEERLPELVRRLREPGGVHGGRAVAPIDVHSSDEIGEVAQAFDEVHLEAVRLAADDALLRGNINAMFVNLSRRSQSLIERQLRVISDLEQGEEDPERLSSLFQMDHMATRMRRHCENLLVLGGQDQVRRWNAPVPLLDIVRASLSEIEQYERVSLQIQEETDVGGPAVSDLVHLVAELVENAITFSPRDAQVSCSSQVLGDGGAILRITDNGFGMSAQELEAANRRLADPPIVDVAASRRMGLVVVGRLAARHAIRVELHAQAASRTAMTDGLTALVLLPPTVVSHGGTTSAPAPLAAPTLPAARRRPVLPAPEPLRARGLARPGRASSPRRYRTPYPEPEPEQPPVSSARAGAAPDPQAGGPGPGPERLPIFEAVESEWFKRGGTRPVRSAATTRQRAETWTSPGDAGWRAAEAARTPAVGAKTAAGLPKRVPGSNRVPGSANAVGADAAPRASSPDIARSRFSSFQQAVRRGRGIARAEGDEP